MESMHNSILKSIAATFHKAILKSYPESETSIENIFHLFGPTPNISVGHLSFPCFTFAKSLKKSPPTIVKEIASNLESNDFIESYLPTGPYLNIKFNLKNFAPTLINEIIDGSFFNKNLCHKSEHIMFEYSQPNTHKELHVGHMRNLCLGNALVELNRYVGHIVHPVTYPGDVGTHVAKCLWFLKYHNKDEVPTENKGTWLSSIYVQANSLLDKQKNSDKEDLNKNQLTEILKQIESKNGEFFELWKETREWSIDLFKQTYEWADIKFDRWFFESDVDSSSLKRVQSLYNDGKLIKSNGAIGLDLEEQKLGFCMLVKSDGNGLYATKDIELAYEKFENYNLDKNIYIVDVRQSLHFKQVFAVLDHVGFKHATKCQHLSYDFVELPSGAMSSRKGNVIPLMKLITTMEEYIKTNYLSKHLDSWTPKMIDETATMIANGAIKYGMIKMDNNKKIVFEMNDWLRLDGDTGPYLQYVHARIATMLEKFNFSADFDFSTIQFEKLSTNQEISLFIHLLKFNQIAYQAATLFKTNTMCSYLFELGKLFNSFYAECPIGKAENDNLKNGRLALSDITGRVMKQGLLTLGIQSPLKM